MRATASPGSFAKGWGGGGCPISSGSRRTSWSSPSRRSGCRLHLRPGAARRRGRSWRGGSPRPVPLHALAARWPRRKVTWRQGTKGKLSGRFAWRRVWPGHGWQRGDCAGAEPVWLLIEEQADGKIKYGFSNLPADTSCKQAVRLWKSRWPVEQGYQQLKEELGLDHFEGRSWRGLHHHVCMTVLAYGFLLLERQRAERRRHRRRKKGVPSRR